MCARQIPLIFGFLSITRLRTKSSGIRIHPLASRIHLYQVLLYLDFTTQRMNGSATLTDSITSSSKKILSTSFPMQMYLNCHKNIKRLLKSKTSTENQIDEPCRGPRCQTSSKFLYQKLPLFITITIPMLTLFIMLNVASQTNYQTKNNIKAPPPRNQQANRTQLLKKQRKKYFRSHKETTTVFKFTHKQTPHPNREGRWATFLRCARLAIEGRQ